MVTDTAILAIDAKTLAFGTECFDKTAATCAKVLAAEYSSHVNQCGQILQHCLVVRRGGWKLNRELLNGQCRTSSIPPLRVDKTWLLTPNEKADVSMKTFASKRRLPEQDGELSLKDLPAHLPKCSLIRRRWIDNILKNLDPDKASGPDGLPSRVLRECAHELATPICMIARGILQRQTTVAFT